MKKLLVLCCVCFVCLSLAFIGCSQKKAATSSEAIANAKSINSVDAQVDYLVKQAEMFYASKEYKEAVTTAQYVINNIDKESEAAQNLVEKAKAEMSGALKDLIKNVQK